MTRVPGLGAKKAAVLHKELNIQSLEELKAACEAGLVRKLKGFGVKTEESILAGLAIASAASERIYWCDADEIVQSITAHMKQSPSIVRMRVGRKLSARPRNGGRSRLAGSQHRPRTNDGSIGIVSRSNSNDLAPVMKRRCRSRRESVSTRYAFGGSRRVRCRATVLHGSKDHNVHTRRLEEPRG